MARSACYTGDQVKSNIHNPFTRETCGNDYYPSLVRSLIASQVHCLVRLLCFAEDQVFFNTRFLPVPDFVQIEQGGEPNFRPLEDGREVREFGQSRSGCCGCR